MADDGAHVLAAPWAFGALQNALFKDRCVATIVDTVVPAAGGGEAWLFTSKAGEVSRKRSVNTRQLSERFLRLAAATGASNVACVRWADGRTRLLGTRAFEQAMVSWPPFAKDASVVCVQSHVAGAQYRNAYRAAAASDRVVTQTHILPSTHEADDDGHSAAPAAAGLDKSRATSLNSTLDAATASIVQFLEKTQRVKIESLEADYALDGNAQLWLLWLGAATCAQRPPAQRPASGPRASTMVQEDEVAKQVNLAARRLEATGDVSDMSTTDRSRGASARRRSDAAGSAQEEGEWPVRRAPSARAASRARYPTALRCAGDYCEMAIHDPKQLFSATELASLSQADLARVRDLVRGASTLAHSQPAMRELASVTYKSVAAARDERRGLGGADIKGDAPAWTEYPVTPRDGPARTDDDGARSPARARQKSGAFAATEASRRRDEWPAARGAVYGGAAQHYEAVRVCRNCVAMYSLLDEARLLFRSEAVVAEKAKKHAVAVADAHKRRTRPAARTLGPPPEDAALAVSTADAPSPQQPLLATWKGRLPEAELYGEAAGANQRAAQSRAEQTSLDSKFAGLDDYLRGRSDDAARKAEARAAALARSRAAQAKLAEAVGDHANRLYFGRVLVVEKRTSTDLERTVSVLEAAGYVVDVELDAVVARERLLHQAAATPGLWQHDAVLVSDDLDLGDAFDVVKEVRRLEQLFGSRESARCAELAVKRASKPRAAALAPTEAARRQQHLPVVIMAVGTGVADLRAYREAQMDGCVSKPMKSAALLSTMRAAVPRHGATLQSLAGGASEGAQPAFEKDSRLQGGGKTVEFSLSFDRDVAAELGKGSPGALLDQVASQLGLDPATLAFKVDARVAQFRVSGFRDGDRAKAFAANLRSRNQVVDESRWGRHVVSLEGEFKVAPAAASQTRAHVAGAFGTSNAENSSENSSAMAAKSMALPASFTAADGSVGGTLQLDADTSLPYAVVDFSAQGSAAAHAKAQTFNLVVCHDFFETFERMKIVLAPIAARYPGLQVLLWNYPGQAFTEWREEQSLNNVFLASCLNELITHVGRAGTRQFDDAKPFFLLGVGYGASVTAFYAAHYGSHRARIRGLLNFNGWSFVDPNLAGALHDAMNVFSCAPPSRPDLPVYFWSRFLFSREYLTRVSTPLALNLYTAVHNPITLKGRMQLCTGALASHDVRPTLSRLGLPVIAVHSTHDVLVKPLHAQPWAAVAPEGDACATIHQALRHRRACVVWVRSGHEVFQEARASSSVLIEQLVVGYHELHDMAFVPAHHDEGRPRSAPKDALAAARAPGHGNFEDSFIDNVLGKLRDATNGASKAQANGGDEQQWDQFQKSVSAEFTAKNRTGDGGNDFVETKAKGPRVVRRALPPAPLHTVLDPQNPAFERQDNVVYATGSGSRIYPTAQEYPEVKEYMGWRLKRNRKRLQRLDLSARVIQNAFRNYLAWTVVKQLRQARAISYIQRAYRGWRGRRDFVQRMRRVWAAHVIQRFWRGCAGRGFFVLLKAMHAASAQVQRLGRGFLARTLVRKMMRRRGRAATVMQAIWRGRMAMLAAFELRFRVDAARAAQRVYRGHLGRRRALNERHKFLFSKSQSAGIEFGRQMLLEHKLHATRLQSEVSLLTADKVVAEESVEALLEEISEFEQGVSQLEREMHQLSRIESEAAGVLDEEAKVELREQKMRLDREFGAMLSRIAERRQALGSLEGKLSTLDRARQGKEEELRSLERKLVLLLEEQQRELAQIRRRQEAKTDVVARQHGSSTALVVSENQLGQGWVGPSIKEKKQAAQLMQSTETMMKFGFMSMSMTYFSSLNMIRAMRTVAAQDTVMGALQANQEMGLNNGRGGGGGGGTFEDKLGGEAFKPALRPGQAPGDEALKVSAWSVDDVARWLQTLSLGQYREAFIDAAVDGAFLYDLDDDDLRNTLGIEHKLHRKKIMNMTNKLRAAEAERNAQLRIVLEAEGDPRRGPQQTQLDSYARAPPAAPEAEESTAPLHFEEIALFVRHGKYKKVLEALEGLPNKKFDSSLVKVAYVNDFGTAYLDSYEREHFNLNKADEHGNTMLLAAAQNGNLKIAKLLAQKGANANHQNKAGQTAGHYANAYQFYDFMSWLFDPSGAAADDTLENAFGLGIYDGLSAELEEG
ncbi:hypothetical protein M885DRAFT_463166 [Pelagophyceae sp. CCMP2097]|nr:hypothetical protein M885DRAFT_463166 [Pelagophyceae sp. CCMP2097]